MRRSTNVQIIIITCQFPRNIVWLRAFIYTFIQPAHDFVPGLLGGKKNKLPLTRTTSPFELYRRPWKNKAVAWAQFTQPLHKLARTKRKENRRHHCWYSIQLLVGVRKWTHVVYLPFLPLRCLMDRWDQALQGWKSTSFELCGRAQLLLVCKWIVYYCCFTLLLQLAVCFWSKSPLLLLL